MTQSILVIDDDPAQRDMIRFLLELEGYRVRTAGAAAGLALTACEQPDLVLLDLDMPMLDGMAVRDCLLADADTATIPVVAMAEAGRLDQQRHALKVQGILVKPLHYRTLLDEVARHVETAIHGWVATPEGPTLPSHAEGA